MTFETIEAKAEAITSGIARRFLAQLALATVERIVRRARRKGIVAELCEADLPEVAEAFCTFALAVTEARARLGSDPTEN